MLISLQNSKLNSNNLLVTSQDNLEPNADKIKYSTSTKRQLIQKSPK